MGYKMKNVQIFQTMYIYKTGRVLFSDLGLSAGGYVSYKKAIRWEFVCK